MVKEFNNIDEMKDYYVEKTNTYVFKEDDRYFDVKFNFDLDTNAKIEARNITARNIAARNITARNIAARDITAWHITAGDIDAGNITAGDINYYAVCCAYNITCSSIKGRRDNARHFVLDGELVIKGE